MNRFLFTLLAMAPTLVSVQSATPAASKTVELVILHVNDLHGWGFPREYLGSDVPERLHEGCGGLFAAATRVKQIRAELFAQDPELERTFAKTGDDGILFLDAGDQWSGTLDDTESQGRAIVELLTSPDLDVNVSVPGNHAFDFGQPRFATLNQKITAHHPMLCANLKHTDGHGLDGVKPWVILPVRGVRVGIVGLVTGNLLVESRPDLTQGLAVDDPIATLGKSLDEMHALPPGQRPELVVVLSHVAFDRDMKDAAGTMKGYERIARMDDVKPGDDARTERNVDLVVDGHSHLDLERKIDSNTWMVQADHFGLKLGEVRITWDPQAHRMVGEPRMKRQLLFDKVLPPDADMLKHQQALVDHVKQIRDQPLVPCEPGLAYPTLPRSDREHLDSPAGDLLTRAFLDVFNARSSERAQVALINQTGVREGLFGSASGVITAGSVQSVSPFENALVFAKVPAGKLVGLLEKSGLQHLSRESWAGIEVVAEQQGSDGGAENHRHLVKVQLLVPNGEPVDLMRADQAQKELGLVAPAFVMGRELKDLIVPGSKRDLGWTDVTALKSLLETVAHQGGTVTRAHIAQLLGTPTSFTIH